MGNEEERFPIQVDEDGNEYVDFGPVRPSIYAHANEIENHLYRIEENNIPTEGQVCYFPGELTDEELVSILQINVNHIEEKISTTAPASSLAHYVHEAAMLLMFLAHNLGLNEQYYAAMSTLNGYDFPVDWTASPHGLEEVEVS